MSSEAFEMAIDENPSDETTRLVYFDYLSERGETEDALDVLRPIALARHLGCSLEDVEHVRANLYSAEGDEYTVYTNEEADKAAKEDALDSVWAYNADFLIHHINFPEGVSDREWDRALAALRRIQEEMCEDASPLIRAMIKDEDALLQSAIDTDGRGHFLNRYDGGEEEEQVNGNWFFIYRQ